ncbi:putative disease resistance RPP13-like protein 1 [Vigna unguiculata]|uniref:putative disease resistance RPP13-like protein 1 n=1 Tax=Vigna unguiculata TaxID=3917 RepID=UPI001016F40E|nr:putative disease resistance RPP13-like protein 1 [Vigna unguiculata]
MAMELVAGPLMGAVFNVLLERIASTEVVNFFKNKNCEKLLKRLKIILLSVNVVLNDAEEKQMKNGAVKEWLEELKDVAFAAEDLLDEIYTDAKMKAKQVNTLHTGPVSFYCKGVEEKIEDVHERLEFIMRQKEVLDLKVGKEVKMSQKTPTSSVMEACDVYGRDNDKESLVDLVLTHDEKIGVIPIVGMGGIGKTTLAQLIYNDQRVQKEFDLKAWIYVSEEFDICKITKTLLEAVTSCSCDTEDLNFLQRDLKMHVMKKKFLFVLDDVWNENYDNWDKFRSPFKHAGEHGSKIIVTTRSGCVASIMQTVSPYNLRELSNEDSWNLFSKHAFDYGDSSLQLHQSLDKVGREIVRKCKGLPLAVKTLAGLLRCKSDRQEWCKVLNSEIWDLHDSESNILPALRLSYHYLPSHLKRCFAYCAIFPKDYEFEKENLVLLWMAEGFLQQSKRHRRIEEVGNEYFCELVSRSFFQQSRRGKSCFLMHHLVNDLAQFVSGTFSIRMECSNTNEIKERTRHLSHIIADSSSYVNLKDASKANCLRTFLQIRPVGTSIDLFNNMPNDLLTKLRCLRVLSLVGTHIYSLPNSVGELKHLRYLEVADTEIVRLPKSICSLFNLQTLKLVGCHNLIELPASIHKLVNLRHLDIRGTSLRWMPLQINELNNLQNLSDFFVGKGCGSSIGELGELSCLHGELFIHCLEHIVSEKDCEKAKLKEKQGLEKLSLEWCGNGETDNSQKEKTILNSLQPHTNLKNLDIYDYPGTEFPEWLGDHSFYNLVSVLLNGSKYCYKLPPLGQLPMLKELQISKFEGLVSVGSEFLGNRTSYVTDCFPALEILRIEYMPSWEKWYPNAENAGTKAFFHLREFHIGNCPKLRGDLPDKLPSLTLLVIRDCKRLLCSLPNSPSLRVLNVQNCESLEFQVHSPCCHQSLTSLFLHGSCDSLVFLPLDLFPNIKSLDIWGCKNLEALTVSESDSTPPTFKSLHSLRIRHCPNFTSFPKGGFAASKLTLLTINYCQKLNSLPEQMHDLMPSLKEVQLRGCPKIESSRMRPLRIRICSKHMEGKQNLSDPLFARLKGLATDQSPSSS